MIGASCHGAQGHAQGSHFKDASCSCIDVKALQAPASVWWCWLVDGGIRRGQVRLAQEAFKVPAGAFTFALHRVAGERRVQRQ